MSEIGPDGEVDPAKRRKVDIEQETAAEKEAWAEFCRGIAAMAVDEVHAGWATLGTGEGELGRKLQVAFGKAVAGARQKRSAPYPERNNDEAREDLEALHNDQWAQVQAALSPDIPQEVAAAATPISEERLAATQDPMGR